MPRTTEKNNLILGMLSAWSVCLLLILYIPVTILGILALRSPRDPIADPYFTIMEVLILLIAPLLTITFAAFYIRTKPTHKIFSLIALICMSILAVITSCVHFMILTVSKPMSAAGISTASLLFSFKWPSVVYALDILAWDWFFGLSVIFAACACTEQERTLRRTLILSGVLSLIGLIGVPTANMNIRNIGILGYTIVAAAAFYMMGVCFRKQLRAPILKKK